MDELPVEAEEVHGIYQELADEVLADEESLKEDLPVDTTAGVSTYLGEVVDSWEDARKSLRTVPVANVYTRELGDPIESSVLRVLVGLDAQVNVLDDIIDTRDLSTQRRVALTANAAFSSLSIAEHAPPVHRQAITTVLREYFTALFQIPLVEARLFEEMREAETTATRREASREIYSYRARDIDAFAHVPALVAGLDERSRRRLRSDLRAYRARRLLFKDIHDVPRDLDDDDVTPVVALLESSDSIETTVAEIERIYEQFEYTTTGSERYGDVLRELENAPDDLSGLLREQERLVGEPAG